MLAGAWSGAEHLCMVSQMPWLSVKCYHLQKRQWYCLWARCQWGQPSHNHHLVKMLLLVATPGSAAEALSEAEWRQVDRSHLSSWQKRKTPGLQLTENDGRLNRAAMRLGEDGQGTFRERDWTTQAPGFWASSLVRLAQQRRGATGKGVQSSPRLTFSFCHRVQAFGFNFQP